MVAGVRSIGTKSAIIALTNYSDEILKNYNKSEEWALIVQGFDMNSDGKIDHVDVVSSTYYAPRIRNNLWTWSISALIKFGVLPVCLPVYPGRSTILLFIGYMTVNHNLSCLMRRFYSSFLHYNRLKPSFKKIFYL